jgi:hypothetical protein
MEKFMKYNPDDPDAYNFLATCYQAPGQIRAVSEFSEQGYFHKTGSSFLFK